MNVNKNQHSLILEELTKDPAGLGYSSMTQKQKVSALLDRPLVENLEPIKKVPKPMDKSVIFGLITPVSLRKISDSTIYSIGDMINSGDRDRLSLWCNISYIKGFITIDEKTKLDKELSSLIDDPEYKKNIRGKNRMEVILNLNSPVNFSLEELEEVESGK